MRVLGIDFGSKRIGLAVGETGFGIVTPRPTLNAAGKLDTDIAAILTIAKKEAAELLVVGVPEMEDASDGGRRQRICREVGTRLEAQGAKVAFVDEALTSVQAEAALRETGLTAAKRKTRRDGEAAAQILERYMAQADRNG